MRIKLILVTACRLEGDNSVVAGSDPESDLAQDIKYHLLRLYTDRSHSLERTLNSSSHTTDHLDCRFI